MRRAVLTLLLNLLVVSSLTLPSLAEEIGFAEDFALAADREAALKQLVPGSEDYYFYHCLHLQNTEQFNKVAPLLKLWVERHGRTQRVQQIQHRQALLTYQQDSAGTLSYITRALGLRFDHSRRQRNAEVDLPSVLNPKIISRATLKAEALRRDANLGGFAESGLDWLIADKLTDDQRRYLLQRLQRPDYPNLVDLVAADLDYRYSPGFGGYNIHRQMLKTQLEALLKKKPALLQQTNYAHIYITKLRPNPDVDWRNTPAEYVAYLDRLWAFAEQLPPSFNSLKSHVLYHRLVYDLAQGKFNEERFLTYIKLPKHASYVEPKYLQREDLRRHIANLNENFDQVTLLPVVGNDEPLVRDLLAHFFLKAKTWENYAAYINDLYLKRVYATTKIVNGLGEPEQWASLLSPAEFQALKQRIDIDFSPQNAERYEAGAAVALDLFLKNTPSLIVNVYEINALNFYRENGREVDASINLDGLVANEEMTFTYGEPPLRRVSRHFEFPSLRQPGVYVIDFIGNGRSSRAVVRKGKLDYLVETTAAGHFFKVLNEDGELVKDASLWLGGREHHANENGEIQVPFSTSPGPQNIILQGQGVTTLARFQQEDENYSLSAAFYVDRENLLTRREAKLTVRPALRINGQPTSLGSLENVRLTITSTDLDGVSVSKEVPNFELFEDRESVYEFKTPDRLVSIQFALRAQIERVSRANDKVNLSASQAFSLNQIDQSDKIEALYLATIEGQDGDAVRVIDLLGKTGEPLPGRVLQLSLKHRDFTFAVNAALQTDEQGRVHLGPLTDIETLTAVSPMGVSHIWQLHGDRAAHRNNIHGAAGETVATPYLGSSEEPQRDELSLLETRNGIFVADRFEALAIKDGLLTISDLPEGDYDLYLKDEATRIHIRLTNGAERFGYAIGSHRRLEVRGASPLQIASLTTAEETITVQLKNASPFTRVHVYATRYQPEHDPFAIYSSVRDLSPLLKTYESTRITYAEGRDIGDEYRYILERRYAQKLPGNMLERPSLLLNPWALRTTETAQQQAEGGGAFGGEPDPTSGPGRRPSADPKPEAPTDGFNSYDFLAETSPVVLNIEPNEDGVVEIKREAFGWRQHVHVVAIDPTTTVVRSLALPEPKPRFLDLRLTEGLEVENHFTQQKQVSIVAAGDQFELGDIGSSRFEAYGSLPRVYRLYSTLNAQPHLSEFSFVMRWNDLKPEEKKAKYSEYACHELNFFVFKKDPKFFAEVVQPYLAHKKDKTFLDHWLLENDLRVYLEPWNYERLNIVERILLGQRMKQERAAAERHVEDLFALLPPNVDRFNHLFNTSVKSGSLDTDDLFGFADEQAEQNEVVDLDGLLMDQLKNTNGVDALGLSEEARAGAVERTPAPAAAPPPTADSPADPFGAGPSDAKGRSNRARDAGKKSAERDTLARGKRKDASEKADAERFYRQSGRDRTAYERYFVKLDRTKEWVENNYYQLPIEQQLAGLVSVNGFWVDYANHQGDDPFLSTNFAEASGNFTEMMFALSVLDLPFADGEHKTEFDDGQMTLTAGAPLIVFHEEILPAAPADEQTPILVSQNLFRHGDRYRHENNERFDKYVTDEFLIHAVYGCQVVVTNPTSSAQKLNLLLQIPEGALPVQRGKPIRNQQIQLGPYSTTSVEYYFYFPGAGDFDHFPVHISKNEKLVASAPAVKLHVVRELTKIDRESWDYVSQYGTNAEVLDFLKKQNVHRLNLELIAFRMRDKEFFQSAILLLQNRHAYNNLLWSYGVTHNHPGSIRDFLKHADGFVRICGPYLESPLLNIDPVARHSSQHRDYKPLVNARAHQLGREREILNDRFYAQYHQLLDILSRKTELTDENRMAVVYYMLLQDRVQEGIAAFEQVDPDQLETRLQYDYFAAYLDFFKPEPEVAADIAQRYAKYPVDRWRKAFAAVTAHLQEAGGAKVELVDDKDPAQAQTQLASSSPSFDFEVESKKVTLHFQNLDRVQVNFYLMDIELLFSRNPFVQQYSGRFSYIRPNQVDFVELPGDKSSVEFPLPEALQNKNVLVEITGAGQTQSHAYYSHSLALQTLQTYGQVRVVDAETGKPLPKTYVKAYAQFKDGTVKFYKDGYTDIRGRFDYASLSTNELDQVQKFSLLILSDTHGAIVREVKPPKQ